MACTLAFLSLLGINMAASGDIENCIEPICKRFTDRNSRIVGTYSISYGDGDENLVTYPLEYYEKWGPDASWFLVLVCIPMSIITMILIAISRFPIPSDDFTMDPIDTISQL